MTFDTLTLAETRAWIASRLDPIETYDPATPHSHSDFDLNPDVLKHEQDATDEGWSQAAVLVALVEHATGLNVLLTRRADGLRKHSGQIAFPGGRCDPGETPWAAALREAHEEIGLDPGLVTLAGLAAPYRTGTGFEVTPVVGFIKPGFQLAPNPAEVADIFETPFRFLMDPGNHERRVWERADGARRQFYAMTHDDRTIWGATAGMLRALYERLYGDDPAP